MVKGLDVKKYTVLETSLVVEVLEKLGEHSVGAVVVVDHQNRVVGTITDGDVRRSLVSGSSLQSRCSEIMCVNPKVLTADSCESRAYRLMSKFGVSVVPIVCNDGRLVRLVVNSPKYLCKDIPFVIMAGGRGERMMPLTAKCPKPMLEIGNKPLIEHILLHGISQGFERFYVTVNYLKEQIMDYLGDGSEYGVSIDYIIENEPQGTAGCLRELQGAVNTDLLVTNGDVLTQVPYSQLIKAKSESAATLLVAGREWKYSCPYGVLSLEGKTVVGVCEKPAFQHFISAGIYVLDAFSLGLIEDGFFDMPTLIDLMVARGHSVDIFPIHEDWVDVGRQSDLVSVRSKFA